jgi:hypothetical protein
MLQRGASVSYASTGRPREAGPMQHAMLQGRVLLVVDGFLRHSHCATRVVTAWTEISVLPAWLVPDGASCGGEHVTSAERTFSRRQSRMPILLSKNSNREMSEPYAFCLG